MGRVTALMLGLVAMFAIVLVSVVLVVSFHGNDTEILISAIIGFSAPTILGMFTLLQGAINGEKADNAASLAKVTANAVNDVNKKVNGHLATLTQAVVNSAATGLPIDAHTINALAERTALLTGIPISPGNVPIPPTYRPNDNP
jgi:hypothetical protein